MTSTLEGIGLPFEEAIDFFRQKGRVSTKHWTDVWRTAHSHSFMVAGATGDALLSDFQKAIQKALKDGTTLAEFRRDFDSIVERHGWSYNGTPGWRSRIIYETNLSTAYSAGRYAQMTEPETLAAFPYWQYQHSGSSHPRLQHLAWNGLTLRADDPFWQSHYPPNGWRCGCRARVVSESGLKRMGKTAPDPSPPIETRPWRNPNTGEVHQVPVGIDPGFDYNPGMAWKRGAKALPVDTPKLALDRAAPAAGPAPANPAEIARWAADPVGVLPAGRMEPAAMKALGADVAETVLTADTWAALREAAPALSVDDLQALPEMIARPDRVMQLSAGELLMISDAAQRLAVRLQATGDRTQVFVVEVKRLRDRAAWEAERRRGKRVRSNR